MATRKGVITHVAVLTAAVAVLVLSWQNEVAARAPGAPAQGDFIWVRCGVNHAIPTPTLEIQVGATASASISVPAFGDNCAQYVADRLAEGFELIFVTGTHYTLIR